MRILTAGFETRNGNEVLQGGENYTPNTVLGGWCAGGDNPIAVGLPNLTEFYISFAYRVVATGVYERFKILDSAGNVVVYFTWGDGTKLKAYRNEGSPNAQLGESTGLMREGWSIVEIHFKYASSGGVIEVRRDGVSILNVTDNTKPASSEPSLTKVEWRTTQGQTFQLDDISLNDITGSEDNSWCGYNHVIGLIPNINGDSSGFVGSDGNSTNNYQLVDDVPASTGDYVESDVLDTKDFYNVSTLSLSANDVIQRVWVGARARVTNTDGGNGLKLGVKSSGAEIFDASAQLLGIDWAYYRTADIKADGAGAWNESKINALQIGMKVS